MSDEFSSILDTAEEGPGKYVAVELTQSEAQRKMTT